MILFVQICWSINTERNWKLTLFFILLCLSGLVGSQVDDPISQRLEKIYSSKSNQEISELLSSWSFLSPLERRFLLAETRGRLDGGKRRDLLKEGRINVRVDRRYGSSVNNVGVTKFEIRTQVKRKIEGGVHLSSSASRIEELSRSQMQKPNIVSRRQSPFSESRAEFRSVTYGSGFERRAVKADSSDVKRHKKSDEAVQLREKDR